MRPIDADALEEILTTAIRNMRGMAKFLGAEDDPEIKMEIKAYTDILEGVKELSTVDADTGWIPVEDRLPEETGYYLVTMTQKADAEELGFPMNEIDVRKMRYDDTGWRLPYHCPEWLNDVIVSKVLAWMPLPSVYKPKEDNEC